MMEAVFQAWADLRLTENHQKQFHCALLRHRAKDERHRGECKTLRNDVGAFDESGTMVRDGYAIRLAASNDRTSVMA